MLTYILYLILAASVAAFIGWFVLPVLRVVGAIEQCQEEMREELWRGDI